MAFRHPTKSALIGKPCRVWPLSGPVLEDPLGDPSLDPLHTSAVEEEAFDGMQIAPDEAEWLRQHELRAQSLQAQFDDPEGRSLDEASGHESLSD